MWMWKELKKEEVKIKIIQELVICHARYDTEFFDGEAPSTSKFRTQLSGEDSDRAKLIKTPEVNSLKTVDSNKVLITPVAFGVSCEPPTPSD